MTAEDDLRDLHERTVESGVDRIVEMVEAGGDYMPLILHLSEVMDAVQSSMATMLALCVEKELFTMDEFNSRRSMATAMLDQFGASARDAMLEAVKERLGK